MPTEKPTGGYAGPPLDFSFQLGSRRGVWAPLDQWRLRPRWWGGVRLERLWQSEDGAKEWLRESSPRTVGTVSR